MGVMQEACYVGDLVRENKVNSFTEDDMYAELATVFPWVNRNEYFSISSEIYHEVLGEGVVSCCLPKARGQILIGKDCGLSARKFCMQSKTSFLRTYELYEGERPAWMPQSGKIIAVGRNLQEFGRPYPELASTFADFYFGGDADDIESSLGLPQRRGAYSTWYGVTVVNGNPVRVKQYCYEEQNQFSDWDVAYMIHCKAIDRMDLLE